MGPAFEYIHVVVHIGRDKVLFGSSWLCSMELRDMFCGRDDPEVKPEDEEGRG